MKYEILIDLPYSLGAYEQVTLKERLDRELKSFLADNEAEVVYLAKAGNQHRDELTQEEKAELTARVAEISTKMEEYHTTINDSFNHIQLMWKAIGKAFGLENKNR